ncbi:MAG: type II secretion system protein D [Thiobacillaceae bacterium]|jgi:general secretion pathway protein D|nr:type II secretion system protein D [Hydrogenophilales bacterium]MBP8901730.1 type II secretion system protein D [Thiobacillaceae bacterium]MBP9915170.1 type II secretion system protein D [Thiobacillaceae bacterium]
MNKNLLWLACAGLMAACANNLAPLEGEKLVAEGRMEEGLKALEKEMNDKPGNVQARAAYLRTKEGMLRKFLAQAESAMKAERFDEAVVAYQEMLRLHPENARAKAGLADVETAKANRTLLAEAEALIKKGEFDPARAKLRAILAKEPGNGAARALLKQAEELAGKASGTEAVKLDARFQRPVTLEFRDASLRNVFDALSRQSGLNFVFDKDVRTDARVTVYARDTAITDAMDMLLSTSQLYRKILNKNTVLVYPNIPAKQREYQDLVVKSFFLANADAKTTLNMVKSLAKTRDVFVDEKLNLLVVRDTPDAVRMIERLIAVQDRPEPEVMLEVEILEIKRSKLQEVGVQWPTTFSVLSQIKNTTPVFDQLGNQIGETVSYSDAPLTLELIKNVTSGTILVNPSPTVTLRKDEGDVNLLANPRIRVKNREKAKVHVGDKVPVITANTTSTGVVSESVAYLDVGLKLEVEPQVHLEGDVGIKVGLEVSSIVKEVKSATGTLTYQLGSRNAATTLRLRDGETQVLAGLIGDEDRSSASKVPGLGDIPILGRLFSTNRDDRNKSEIVLLITPRVVRNVERPELAQGEFFAGTEAAVSDQPQLLRPAAGAAPGGLRAPAQPAPVEPEPVAAIPNPGAPPAPGALPVPAPVPQP